MLVTDMTYERPMTFLILCHTYLNVNCENGRRFEHYELRMCDRYLCGSAKCLSVLIISTDLGSDIANGGLRVF